MIFCDRIWSRLLRLGAVFVALGLAHLWAPLYGQGTPEKKSEQKEEKVPELVERIRLVLRFGHSQQVRDSLKKVSELKEEEQKSLIPDIRARIEGADPLLQVAIVRTVGEVAWSDLDNEIVPFLESDVNEVIFSTCAVVRKKKILAAVPHVQKYLTEADYTKENNNKITEYLQLAGEFEVSSLAGMLFEKLKAKTTQIQYRNYILSYFAKIPDISEEIIQYMVGLVNDPKEDVTMRAYAVNTLGRRKYAPAAEAIKKELEKINNYTDIDKKKKYGPLRIALIAALIQMGDSDVAKVLVNMTLDDDPLVRQRAIRQIGELKDPQYVELLEYKAKHDPEEKVRNAAKKALEEIQGEEKPSE